MPDETIHNTDFLTIDDVMARLKAIKARRDKGCDQEEIHVGADAVLVDFVADCCLNPEEFRALWDSIPKWYA